MYPISIFNIVKATIVVLVIILFIIKLLEVSIYQHHSGEHFFNKLLNWYSNVEIGTSLTTGRRKTMTVANRFNTALWALTALLLMVICNRKNYPLVKACCSGAGEKRLMHAQTMESLKPKF